MLCRLCLGENIKDAVSCTDFPEVVEIVKNTLNVSMDEEIDFPRTVCVGCYDKTMEFYAFRTRCLENQKTLKIREIRQKVAEKIKLESQEDENEVVFVCEMREEQAKETPRSVVKTCGDVRRQRKLKVEKPPEKTFEEHRVKPCSVVVERMTKRAIARTLWKYNQRRASSYTKKYNRTAYINDHTYFMPSRTQKLAEAAPGPLPVARSVIQVMRTYCRPQEGTSKEPPQSPPPPPPETSTPPRIKVLSSAEINSRATGQAPRQRQTLSCTLINNRGRLEFSFTDEKRNVIDFWSMSERQRRDVLNTLQPEAVRRQLNKSFCSIPITSDTQAKLRALYCGEIPFTVTVKD